MGKNLNIVYIHYYFRDPNENGGTRCYDFADYFGKTHNVTVIGTSSKPEMRYWSFEDIQYSNFLASLCLSKIKNATKFTVRMLGWLRFVFLSCWKVLWLTSDLVIVSSTPLTVGIIGVFSKVILGKKYIFEVRDLWPEVPIAMGMFKRKWMQKLLYSLEGSIYRYAEGVVFLSRDMLNTAIKMRPALEAKSIVVTNISEIDRFSTPEYYDLKGSEDEFKIVYCGTFGKVNKVSYLIELARVMRNADISFSIHLFGEGHELDYCVNLSELYDVKGRTVHFYPPVSKSELPAIYAACTVGCSVTDNIEALWKNSANKYFDCLAAGKPILINYFGWQANEINRFNIGYVLSPDIENIDIDAFSRFLTSAKSESIRSRVSNRAVSSYSLEVLGKKYQGFIECLCK